ncbi:hypothetical protein GGI15_004576 [Coemansia interrupta]|uniref:Myb-like domain-containing protein n=1 Tax=Coemansia interrupta TaxID=1126814 RepID=A0A9W8LFN2_9FUNG|nr:hypothetical protein GGI15_004576 [Coemansia interrupta]
MAYRKRSLDLPMPGNAHSAAKHPRNEMAEMSEPGGGPQLPPIRSLNELAFRPRSPVPTELPSSASIPSLRHLQNAAEYHPHGQHGMQQQQHSIHQQPMPPPSAIPPQQQQRQPSNQRYYRMQSHSPVSPMQIVNLAEGMRDSSSTVTAAISPEIDYSASGGSSDTIKVARNWSRDETLSLVRAIGRHYESLKRCKTNQERSNVWHRIHKEHSGQFPGRSKKASQDRWGKVLSDYRDVVINNKEKGAARWTFDFFKEVAAIIDGDPQFMDVSSPSTMSPPSAALPSGRGSATEDHGFSAASGRPPFAYHRMSEPNLTIATSVARSQARVMSPLRPPPPSAYLAGSSQQQQQPQQRQSPLVTEPQSAGVLSSFAAEMHRGAARLSPTRRTSYPQLQTQLHLQRTPIGGGGGGGSSTLGQFQGHPQSKPLSTSSSTASMMHYSMAAAAEHDDSPEAAYRHALDLLDRQIKRIDAQQDELNQLRQSTQEAIGKVEQMMERYARR